MIREDHHLSIPYQRATEFVNTFMGSPDAFSKKIATFVNEKMTVDGEISRSEYDLFCYHILSQLQHNLTLTGLILTKMENDETDQN